MKNLKILNTIAITIPFIILSTYPIFKESSMLFALLSTMITGFVQVIIGINLSIKSLVYKYYYAYLVMVLMFFILWSFNVKIGYNNNLTYFLLIVPPILTTYLSVLIYTNTFQKIKNHES
jgi:hypothetical protein